MMQTNDAGMKMLIGYNGSGPARQALSAVQTYARAFNATVYVVASVRSHSRLEEKKRFYQGNEYNELYGDGSGSVGPKLEIEEAKKQLGQAEAVLAENKIAYESHLLVRDLSPGEDLVDFSRAHGIDLIVIGVRKRSKVGKMMFGSTAQYIILQAPCPVLTVK